MCEKSDFLQCPCPNNFQHSNCCIFPVPKFDVICVGKGEGERVKEPKK